MFRVRWVALFGCGVAVLASVPARAAEVASTPPGYALSWVRAEGAEECPPGRVVIAEVEKRLGRAVFDAAAERSFEVEVTRFGQKYRSDVFVRDAAGQTVGHRLLQSDEAGCGALVNATALAIALVIDPEAAAREPAAGPGAVSFEPPAAPPPPAPAPATPPAPTTPLPPPPSQPVQMRLPLPPELAELTASVRAQLTGGVAPATSPGFELAFSVRPGPRWGVALAGSYALAQSVTRGIGSLDVGVTRASALVTFDAGRSENVRLVLGAGPTLGAFHLAVRTPAPVTDSGDFWFAGLELAARVQVLVTKRYFVELGGTALVPLRRQEFLVRGQAQAVWRQPLLSGLGFLGVGARFP